MGEFLERDSSASTAGPGSGAGAPKAAPERHHRSEETSSLHPKHATSYSSSSCSSSKDKKASKTAAAAATTSSDLNADRFQYHSPGGGGVVVGANNAAPPVLQSVGGNKERSPVVGNPVLENDVKEIKRLLKSYMGRLENKDVSAKAAKEWRLVARVLDRLFFYTYIATIVISWCTFFPRDVGNASSPQPTKSSSGEPLKEQQIC